MIDYVETNDAIFCIMNRINGGTLFELVSKWGQYNIGLLNSTGPFEFLTEKQKDRLEQVIDCTRQIVDALLYMHEEKGIVHGDLKLENVLVEKEGHHKYKMILCDFGMSRVFTTRLSRHSSVKVLGRTQLDNTNTNGNNLLVPHGDSDDLDAAAAAIDGSMIRSKSSNSEMRKPYKGGHSSRTANLDFNIRDDSKIGLHGLYKAHGPSIQSVHLTPIASAPESPSSESLLEFSKTFLQRQRSLNANGVDSDLPHSHIGSLPYASPELLQPAPPPLGPLADVWALGVLLYAMCVGKLPFQHQYEPRLRAIIAAGQYNKDELRKACLLEWILKESDVKNLKKGAGVVDSDSLQAALSHSMPDMKRQEQISALYDEWKKSKFEELKEFEFLYDIVVGCLETNITKRWDMEMIHDALQKKYTEK